jgi:valyl-tRNA synthetase
MDRKKARSAVKKALEEKGLARGTKPHQLTLPRCQRSGDVVEPMISTQWFCKMSGMAKEAIDAVKSGRTQIIPEEWVKTYDHFLENIQDWCVSRQLWWGHQIPAWHGPNGEIRVARERPAECTPENGWTQDPDVLDTWFSSGLWPFSTLGWPDDTPALRRFYPTNAKQESDLETGYDILFFWVARMMMFGLHFTKEVPFRRVLLSGLIVDETGDKMSKVKGNVIDPLDLIHGAEFTEIVKKTLPGAPEAEALTKFKRAYPSAAAMGGHFPAFGADALRFTLATFPPSNKRIALAPKRLEGYRHFINKIWNATRFALDQLEGFSWTEVSKPKALYDRWILSRLARASKIANGGIHAFRIDEAANEAYRFFWSDFCDWYLELTKTVFADNSPFAESRNETRAVLAYVLEGSLRLMHPLMPFVTEELWQRVPKPSSRKMSIAFGPYPGAGEEKHEDAAAERDMDIVTAAISAARTIRSEHDIKWANAVPLEFRTDASDNASLLRGVAFSAQVLAKTTALPTITNIGGSRAPGTAVSVVPTSAGPIEVLVGLKGLVTKDEELARIDREMKRIDKDIAQLDKKLSSKGFVERAPKEVVDETNAQRAAMVAARARLEESRRLADEL